MKIIEIEIDDNIDISEFKKIIGFISEHIISFYIKDKLLHIEVEEDDEADIIKHEVIKLSQKYISNREFDVVEFENKIRIKKYNKNIKSVHYFDDGLISLSGQSLFLFNYFNSEFHRFVYEQFSQNDCDIIEKVYPVLLPISGYKKTGYLKRSPQYSIFCCSACENMKVLEAIDKIEGNEYKNIIDNPMYALSPSACFHVYEEYKDRNLKRNTIVTFTQSVFRNEGRFNFLEYGRMRDYHVKEIVFLGDASFVENSRKLMIENTKKHMQKWCLDSKIMIASDPFVLPRMQKYKKIQAIDRSKYELRMSYGPEEDVSVASFNLHGTAFTHPFNIKVNSMEAVTGCIGYGIERFVLAFLSQYGEDVNNWPDDIRKVYKMKKGISTNA